MFSLAENNIHCRYFQQIDPVHKHAFVKTGEPQHHCRICQRSFQANYRDNAHKQDVKKAISQWFRHQRYSTNH